MGFHWTMDFTSHQGQYDFGKALKECLDKAESVKFQDRWKTCTKTYCILPNYWGGFSTHKEAYQNAGKAELLIKRDGDLQRINGICDQTDSCEKYIFSYTQDRKKGLCGEFCSKVENTHGDLYKEFSIMGKRDQEELSIRSGRGSILLRQPVSEPVYSNWCFLDRLPEVAQNSSFALLENLESYYPKQILRPLEKWVWKKMELKGYALCGSGQPISYYWINSDGHVIIAVQTLMTYVLTEARFEGDMKDEKAESDIIEY